MTYQDWTVRNKDGVAVIRAEGKDYVEIVGSAEAYPAAYPETVTNTVLERGENGLIKVVLGQTRYIVNENDEVEEVQGFPQTVWLQLIDKNTELQVAPEEKEKDGDGFITG